MLDINFLIHERSLQLTFRGKWSENYGAHEGTWREKII